MQKLVYGDYYSFNSYNFPERYIRHIDNKGNYDPIVSTVDQQDSTFKLVKGLAAKNDLRYYSLEASNYPGWYLCHDNFRLYIRPLTGDDFKIEDATFAIENGNADSNDNWISFRSYSYPSRFIRGKDWELVLDPIPDENNPLFNKDTTFGISSPNYKYEKVDLFINRNLPFNDVSFAMAHDSHTAIRNYYDSENVPDYVDQTEVVGLQLLGGIRTVRISTGTSTASSLFHSSFIGKIIVQHTIALGLFKDYLIQVIDFLNDNPNEIVTIIDEGDNDTGWSSEKFFEEVAKVYQKCMGGSLEQPGGDSSVKVYIPQGGVDDWPTIQEMIDRNERLVVFMTKPQNNDAHYRWILPAYAPEGQIGMNIYGAYGDHPDSFYQEDSLRAQNRWPQNENPKLYLFNHYFYDTEAFHIDESSRGYNELTVGPSLIRDVLNAWEVLSLRPNFINVDFYQGVRGATSYLIPLVNAMNKSKSPGEARNDESIAGI